VSSSLLLALALQAPVGEPRVVTIPARPYAAIRTLASIAELDQVLPKLFPEVSQWLAAKGLKPSTPPMIRFLKIDMARKMEIEVGFGLDKAVKGDARVTGGKLPAGRFVQLRYVGGDIIGANASLQKWAASQGLKYRMKGETWVGRVEFYPVDPGDTPDASKWETVIEYMVR